MKKLFTLIIIGLNILSFSGTFAQRLTPINGTVTKKIRILRPSGQLNEGDKIKISAFSTFKIDNVDTKTLQIETINGDIIYIDDKSFNKIEFEKPKRIEELWQISLLNSDYYTNLEKNGYQYDIRNDLDEESIEYLSLLTKYDLYFNDEYLEDYLQTLLYRIHSITLKDQRPGNLSVHVIKDSEPNAACLPNGTILINTGLLSAINTEEELIGILAHEVAHFVLDHQVTNISAQISREKRAAFWAGVATATMAATEAYLNIEHDVNTGGALTLSTAILSTTIASTISDRLGVKYNQEQEEAADKSARVVLNFLVGSSDAYTSLLMKISEYYIKSGNYYAFTEKGSHPSLQSRIAASGNLVDINGFNSKEYHNLVSMVTSYNAILEYNSKHFQRCLELVNRNIEAGIPIESDYILKAVITRSFHNTPEANNEALDLLLKAESLDVNPISWVHKQKGITLMRLKKYDDAILAFNRYLNELTSLSTKSNKIDQEINWTKRMIHKTKSY